MIAMMTTTTISIVAKVAAPTVLSAICTYVRTTIARLGDSGNDTRNYMLINVS